MAVSNSAGEFVLTVTPTATPIRLVCSYVGLGDFHLVVDPAQRVLKIEMSKSPGLLLLDHQCDF